jgi:predicted ArsR family transcriptional regulator
MLNKVAHAIRKRYGYSDEEKESEILRFVKNGAATITELVDEVGFPDREISKIVGELTIKNLVRVEKFRIGRRGRPSLLIFAID